MADQIFFILESSQSLPFVEMAGNIFLFEDMM